MLKCSLANALLAGSGISNQGHAYGAKGGDKSGDITRRGQGGLARLAGLLRLLARFFGRGVVRVFGAA